MSYLLRWWPEKVSFEQSQVYIYIYIYKYILSSLSELLSIPMQSIDRLDKSTNWKETRTDLVTT